MAISKDRKEEILAQYKEWIDKSKATIMTEYTGLSSKEIESLRNKVREAGGEIHVIKNTLGKMAFSEAGVAALDDMFEGSTAVGFAFGDAPDLAKAIIEFAQSSDYVKVKGGALGKQAITADEIKALAELPPLPVMRGQLLGTLMAPATQLARILAEPGRQIAAVIKAYADKDATPAEA